MEINKSLIEDFNNKTSKILAVTKYFDVEETNNIASILSTDYSDYIV
jgi:hypothetical protein